MKYSQIIIEAILRKLFEKQVSHSASCPNHSLILYSVKPRLHRTSSLPRRASKDILTWQLAGTQSFCTCLHVQWPESNGHLQFQRSAIQSFAFILLETAWAWDLIHIPVKLECFELRYQVFLPESAHQMSTLSVRCLSVCSWWPGTYSKWFMTTLAVGRVF